MDPSHRALSSSQNHYHIQPERRLDSIPKLSTNLTENTTHLYCKGQQVNSEEFRVVR
jgi:hypothetical protein